MRYLQAAKKEPPRTYTKYLQGKSNTQTGKRMPSWPAPSFTETVYACGDGTPWNDKCFKITKLKRWPMPRIKK